MEGNLEVKAVKPRAWARLRAIDIMTLAGVVGILALALWLRWDRLDYVEFGNDQASSLSRAGEFVASGSLPLYGEITSVGARQGPVEIWLLAIPAAISRDPRVATGFVGLLQVLAVLGTFLFTATYFGRLAGLVAAALFATNPWAVHFGRKIWPDDLMPLFSLLLFSALFAAVVQRRPLHLSLACLWLVVLGLIHPASVLVVPLLGLVLFGFWRRLSLKALLLGIALGLLVASPFLYYESQHGFASVQAYLNVGAGAAGRVDLEAFALVTSMASAQHFPDMMGYGFRGDWALPNVARQNEVSLLLLFAGLGVCLLRLGIWLRRRRPAGYEWEKYFLLLLWFTVPVLASLRHANPFYPNYFLLVYPIQFVLIALALTAPIAGLAGLNVTGRRYPAAAAGALAIGLAVWVCLSYVGFFRAYLDYVVGNGPQGQYGVPLVFGEKAVDTARALSARLGDHAVYAYSDNQRETLDYLASPNFPLRHVEPPDTVLLPSRGDTGVLAVLASDDAARARRYNLVQERAPHLRRLRALGFEEIPGTAVAGADGYYYYRFFQIPPGQNNAIAAAFTPARPAVRLANGVRLQGYRFGASAQSGGQATLELLWELPEAPQGKGRGAEYNLFVHAIDGQGRRLGDDEREMPRSRDWRAGEVMVSFFEVALPPDAEPALVWFDIGAYSRYDRAPVPWQDASGRGAGPVHRLGPVKIPPPAPERPPAVVADFRFGGQLVLVGYDLGSSRPVAGGDLAVTLRWRATAPPEAEYTVSVQLLDATGSLLAQHDSPPAEGNYPTSAWAAGEEVVDRHVLALGPDVPAGEYRLVVVVYRADDGRRLQVAGGGDAVPLASLSVGPQP